MSLIYKTLFEVKIMHEFFLTDLSGQTKFDEPDQQKRLDFLFGEYIGERDSIDRDLDFSFPDSFELTSSKYNLKLLSSYSGCKVMVRVNQLVQPDSSVVYEPFVQLPDDLTIPIVVSRKNNFVDVYSNGRIDRPVSAAYFFSNQNLSGTKVFPFLTNTIPGITSGYVYEQGELALSGTTIMEFYKDESGADAWKTLTGQAFANETDRMFLPLRFNYSFSNELDITQADFTLKDKNGNTMQTNSASDPVSIRSYSLNFSGLSAALISPDGAALSDYIFTLAVTGSNGYSAESKIIFTDNMYDRNVWAIISIKNSVTVPAFNLIGTDGFLFKRKSSTGIWTDAPVFEIPVKSRFGYWRYFNNKGDELDLIPDLTGYLFKNQNFLQTKEPQHMSKSYFILSNVAGTETKYLPNPESYEIQVDDKRRLCFDIKVPRSDLFPIVP